MIRFLPGILLIQIATIALVLLAPDNLQGLAWLRLVIPLLVVGFFAAFWFAAIAKHKSKDDVARLKEEHAREREKIQINAERAKTRLVKKTQQQISRETKIAHGKANFKVGAALAGVMGLGALMLLTQFLTLGVFTLTTAGGALGGYLYRGRKERNNSLLADQQNAQLNEQQGLTHTKTAPPRLIPAGKTKK
jgi:hypothetical protein